MPRTATHPSMEYWLDGYNVMFRAGWLEDGLEAGRERLLGHLRGLGSPCRAYFDAARSGGITAPPSAPSKVAVVFVREGPADDAIVDALRTRPKGGVTVVTDDRELRGRARQLGAVSLGVDRFLERLRITAAPPSSPRPEPRKEEDVRPGGVRRSEIRSWMDYFGFDPETGKDKSPPG